MNQQAGPFCARPARTDSSAAFTAYSSQSINSAVLRLVLQGSSLKLGTVQLRCHCHWQSVPADKVCLPRRGSIAIRTSEST